MGLLARLVCLFATPVTNSQLSVLFSSLSLEIQGKESCSFLLERSISVGKFVLVADSFCEIWWTYCSLGINSCFLIVLMYVGVLGLQPFMFLSSVFNMQRQKGILVSSMSRFCVQGIFLEICDLGLLFSSWRLLI